MGGKASKWNAGMRSGEGEITRGRRDRMHFTITSSILHQMRNACPRYAALFGNADSGGLWMVARNGISTFSKLGSVRRLATL